MSAGNYWHRLGGDWVISGPNISADATLTVTRRDRSIGQVVIASVVFDERGEAFGVPVAQHRTRRATAHGWRADAALDELRNRYAAAA